MSQATYVLTHKAKSLTLVGMAQFLVTTLLVAIPYTLLLGPAIHEWNRHTRGAAVGFTVLVAIGVLLWQGAWDMAGGMV